MDKINEIIEPSTLKNLPTHKIFSAQNKINAIRISIANLLYEVNGKKIGIFSHAQWNNKRIKYISAIGGGSLVKDKLELFKLFHAHRFEENDARFRIPSNRLNSINEFMANIELNNPFIELNIRRELEEELSAEILEDLQTNIIISPAEVDAIRTSYTGCMKKDVRISPSCQIKTHYFHLLFNATMDEELLQKILKSNTIFELSEEELDQKHTQDGYVIGDNIYRNLNQ